MVIESKAKAWVIKSSVRDKKHSNELLKIDKMSLTRSFLSCIWINFVSFIMWFIWMFLSNKVACLFWIYTVVVLTNSLPSHNDVGIATCIGKGLLIWFHISNVNNGLFVPICERTALPILCVW